MKVGLQVNDASIRSKLAAATQAIEDEVKQEVKQKYINPLMNWVPVDTGAYAQSFSLKGNYSSGRSVTSRGKPRKQPRGPFIADMVTNLYNDLAIVDLKNTTAIVLSNGAPHAPFVENGNGKSRGHQIFARIRGLGRA